MTECDNCGGPIRVFDHVLDEKKDTPKNYCGVYCQFKDHEQS